MKKSFIQCVQNENLGVSPEETITAIKNAGFDGVFVQWYDKNWDYSQQKQVDLCKKLGLKIEFVHLGYENMNEIWCDNIIGENLKQQYINDLYECKKNGIDLVVIHLQSKFDAPAPNKIGLNRFKQIADVARELSIKIAFENTKLQGYLEYMIDNIDSDTIGICLDVGHFHCHFKDILNWEKFKNKIYAVHLHDNFGERDEHLLPFDGTINWNDLIDKLNKANYNGPITLESCYRNDYTKISLNNFYQESYKKAKLIYEISKK